MTLMTDNRTPGEAVAAGSQEHQHRHTGQSDVSLVGGRLFAYACLFAVPAVVLVLIAFGLPRGAGALLGGVLAAGVVSQLIADPGPQAAEVRSARPREGHSRRSSHGSTRAGDRASRSSPAVVTACTHRLERSARQDPHKSGTDSCGTPEASASTPVRDQGTVAENDAGVA